VLASPAGELHGVIWLAEGNMELKNTRNPAILCPVPEPVAVTGADSEFRTMFPQFYAREWVIGEHEERDPPSCRRRRFPSPVNPFSGESAEPEPAMKCAHVVQPCAKPQP
jgi:hypothetical protein